MKSGWVKVLLGSVVLVASGALFAREGDYMGNGGGLGEQNAVFVWTQYRPLAAMCLLEETEHNSGLRAVMSQRALFSDSAFEVRPEAELSATERASARRFEGRILLSEAKIIWVREKLHNSDGQPMSLDEGAYWLTLALASRAGLSAQQSQHVADKLKIAFGNDVRAHALTRYNRAEIRLMTLKGRAVFLESPLGLKALPVPAALCESQNFLPQEDRVPLIGEISWMSDESWEPATSTVYLGARGEISVFCQDANGLKIALMGEIAWELPFTVRDSASGKGVSYPEARFQLSDSGADLIPSEVSWFGVRGLRRALGSFSAF